jgi:flavodoxin
VIFIGSPIWWGTIAPPVAAFLSSHDLTGKTVIPFMTHEGSRMGHSVSDIKKLCPDSVVLDGLPIRGHRIREAQDEVKAWLRKIGIIE